MMLLPFSSMTMLSSPSTVRTPTKGRCSTSRWTWRFTLPTQPSLKEPGSKRFTSQFMRLLVALGSVNTSVVGICTAAAVIELQWILSHQDTVVSLVLRVGVSPPRCV